MKESNWIIGIIMFGLGVFGIIYFVQYITTTSEEDFYLGREVLYASMCDAVDYGTLRTSGKLVMVKEKFVENFIRRFAESVSGPAPNEEYQIDFYDILEYPPKASVKISIRSYESRTDGDAFDLNGDSFSVTVDTLLSGVLETTKTVDEYKNAALGLYE